jgi:hypothetical protein
VGFFRGLLKRRLDKLVTCMLTDKGAYWEAMWVSGGRTPQDFTASTVTEAAERAAVEIGSMYRGDPIAPESELQFAIYPFAGGKLILDVARGAIGFVASNVNGEDPTVQGETLEALVDAARRTVPDPAEVMFRWIRPISELI